ncbi:hypothetical protein [Clavibacter michiganensis]|uniref:hypothetical protein n=1 Tax=Clavibacter michiganensis TaxID=28447 RepID=UPI001FF0E1EE|nr:hypothetical protein [Clavibacter michiganensis]MDO4045668.1 hypothetical protein [Clavibacter michiganensis]MDO4054731.1 hypothetical protein [Clavibacter michiganensis]MDO4058152.1 hypothetical protein [Clavibacter michiganensis]UOW05296.1 hypothetical protein MU580_16050 [Clavibacter michiganensis subsp. michiganensis]
MGHQPSYLDDVSWDASLTLAERQDRGPFQSAFGVGRTDAAADAVARARREAYIADAVLEQVKEQAVYALLCERMSVRAIAEQTRIPKSEVGRISRSLGRDGDRPGSHATGRGLGFEGPVRDGVRAAWGHV